MNQRRSDKTVYSAHRNGIRNRRGRLARSLRPVLALVICLSGLLVPMSSAQARPAALPLNAYPRPAADNGRGVHWAPTLMSQPAETVDRYLPEVAAMNLRWLKLMQPDQPTLEHRYLLSELSRMGIEPVLRVYKPFNDDYTHLDSMVRSAVAAGVSYFELYSSVNVAGLSGGWRPGSAIDPTGLASRWAQAAAAVRQAGGFPALPSLSPTGAMEDETFLRTFLQSLKSQGLTGALEGAWLPVQNYMGNLPLGDPNGFRRFERYHQILLEETGLRLPIITTEGGAIAGDVTDPRYPPLSEATVGERTVAAFAFMEQSAPDYYFAFMPWLMLNAAGGGYAAEYEAHAWYPIDAEPRPVVEAVKAWNQGAPAPPAPMPTVPPTAPLLPTAEVQYATEGAMRPIEEVEESDSDLPEEVEAAASAPDVNTQSGAALPIEVESSPVEVDRVISEGDVTVSEGRISLLTYGYEGALIDTRTDDPIHPAHRLDHGRVGAPQMQTYQALLLENEFVRLTLLPELGGRIYRWEDKASGRDILYHNPVIKPVREGDRGWRLALGGIEWGFPLANYGLYEYRAWEHEIVADPQAAAIVLSQKGPGDLRTSVRVGLGAGQRFFALTTELRNGGSTQLSAHFWNNAALAPAGNNRLDPQSELVWPAESLTVSASSDSRLKRGESTAWPGPGLNSLANWPDRLSIEATGGAGLGAVGVVDSEGHAVVRSFPHRLAPGVRAAFSPGRDPAEWTDGESGPFIELRGGPARDSGAPIVLEGGESLRWTEQWYTVPGLGRFVTANAHAALALVPTNGGTELRLATTGSSAAAGDLRLVVRVDDRIIHSDGLTLSLDEIFQLELDESTVGKRWLVQLFDRQNRVLLAYDSRWAPPQVESATPPIWDERLDDLNVAVNPAGASSGQSYWKIIEADFQDPHEGGGRHHIFIEVLDENGRRMVGQEVEVHWPDGMATVVTEDKPSPELAANFPMYGDLGGYRVRMPGLSDEVTGLGLPGGRTHVVFNVIFQRVIKE